MLETYRKFFRFAGNTSSNWVKSILFEILHCVIEGLQFIPLLLVLHALVTDTMSVDIAWISLGVMLLSIAGRTLAYYFGHSKAMTSCYTMCDNKRLSIGSRMKYTPMGFFNSTSLGNITAVCTSTLEDLEAMAGAVVVRIFVGILHSIIFSIFILVFDWRIGLVYLAGISVFFLVNSRMLAASRTHTPARLRSQMNLVDAVLEFIQGLSVIKAFHLDGKANTVLEKAIEDSEFQNFNLEKQGIGYQILQKCVLSIASVAACLLSIGLTFDGQMEPFVCLLMIVSSFFVYTQIEVAGGMSFMIPMIDASMSRVEEIDDMPSLDVDGTDVQPAHGGIEMEDVSFSYGQRQIFEGLSLSIPEKSSCAIVGPSGSGKTTLVNLIARFWDVDGGAVTLGGIDIRDYRFDTLMAQIGMVFQGVYLFQDSIENNIKFGKPQASHEELVAAAKAACCHDFIQDLPDGYNTLIGEGGATLSGGEKQRISIARAILKDAPIIILDEATANVDPENEAELQAAIEALTNDKTVIMIAHRLKTVRHADQIIVLDEGSIVQKGTHSQLVDEEGIYADFVYMRSKAAGWKLAQSDTEHAALSG